MGSGALGEEAALAQFGAQREQHVEHDADAGDAFRREGAAGLVGIDDAVGVGQRRAGQVVVGDQRGDAEFAGAGDAFEAGDAVVDGDDEVGRLPRGDIDDFRRQAVAELEAVRDEEIDVGAERLERAHAERGGGGAVAVVVADDQQAGVGLDGVGQHVRGVAGMGEGGGRQQRLQLVVEFGLVGDAAGRVQPREQRVQALLFELPDDARRHAAGDDAGHAASSLAVSASGRLPFQNFQRSPPASV